MNWLDEDPELLRAALEIIESWDGESSVNGVAVTSPSPATEETDSNNDEAGGEDGGELIPNSAAASPRAAATNAIGGTASRSEGDVATPLTEPTPNRVSAGRRARKPSAMSTLQKRRDEILYLRHKITFMESQLATLRKQDVDGDGSAGSVMNGVDTTLAVTWHDIASRQLRLRQKAELEQAKLRGLLETQMKVARGLIKLMQRVRGIEGDESFPTAKLPMNASDSVSEEEQCAHVDELYDRIDEAFSFAKFHDGTLKFIDVEVQDHGDDDIFIEMRDAWALPFEIQEVTGAIWAFMGKRVVQKGRQENALTVDAVGANTFTIYYSGTGKVGAFKGTIDGKGVAKWFPATDERCASIISTMNSLPRGGEGGELEGIGVHEDAFLRVVSAQSLTGQSDGRVLSVVQSNRRIRLTFDVDKAPASRRNAGVLTDFVLDHLNQERQFKLETVETLLLHLRSQ